MACHRTPPLCTHSLPCVVCRTLAGSEHGLQVATGVRRLCGQASLKVALGTLLHWPADQGGLGTLPPLLQHNQTHLQRAAHALHVSLKLHVVSYHLSPFILSFMKLTLQQVLLRLPLLQDACQLLAALCALCNPDLCIVKTALLAFPQAPGSLPINNSAFDPGTLRAGQGWAVDVSSVADWSPCFPWHHMRTLLSSLAQRGALVCLACCSMLKDL